MNIPVVYEDEWIVVLDKPSGLLTIPTPKNEPRTLYSILNNDLKLKNLTYRLHPCHRLDRETSGLIIFAKGKSVQHKMMQEFREKRIRKTYVAFASGDLAHGQGEIKFPVEHKPALTRFKLIVKKAGFSVVEVHPVTGRTNQIRLHFRQLGHPILGETKFAFRRDFKIKAKRLCLHAKSLEFIHPFTKKRIFLDSPLPQDMEEFLK